MCVFKLRTLEEWEGTAHAQALALAGAPVVDVRRAGEASKRRFESEIGGRPLGGVKVLDLSRVLAGPVAGRALAGTHAFMHVLNLLEMISFPVLFG
jgi:hypothetical protein